MCPKSAVLLQCFILITAALVITTVTGGPIYGDNAKCNIFKHKFFMVVFNRGSVCGGALVSTSMAIMSRYCFENTLGTRKAKWARAGLNPVFEFRKVISSKTCSPILGCDFALVFMARPFVLNAAVGLVKMPQKGDIIHCDYGFYIYTTYTKPWTNWRPLNLYCAAVQLVDCSKKGEICGKEIVDDSIYDSNINEGGIQTDIDYDNEMNNIETPLRHSNPLLPPLPQLPPKPAPGEIEHPNPLPLPPPPPDSPASIRPVPPPASTVGPLPPMPTRRPFPPPPFIKPPPIRPPPRPWNPPPIISDDDDDVDDYNDDDRGICNENSGGPLLCDNYLIGFLLGYTCSLKGGPDNTQLLGFTDMRKTLEKLYEFSGIRSLQGKRDSGKSEGRSLYKRDGFQTKFLSLMTTAFLFIFIY